MTGVPQGSLVGPVLFNIDTSFFFIIEDCDIANYEDDNNTPSLTDENVENVFNSLENTSSNHVHHSLETVIVKSYYELIWAVMEF